jgi:hypothetical protein
MEERSVRVFRNRALRRMFGPKRDKIIGGWRKLHKEEHHDLALLTKYNYQVKEDGMSRACNTRKIGEECILKWVLERQDVAVDWIHLPQDREQWRLLWTR